MTPRRIRSSAQIIRQQDRVRVRRDPGEDFDAAFNLKTLSSRPLSKSPVFTLRETLGRQGSSDPEDIYRFKINESSNLSLGLEGLQSNADLEILRLNRDGEVVPYRRSIAKRGVVNQALSDLTLPEKGGTRFSNAPGIRPEDINLYRLPPGTYYVRVFLKRDTDSTRYQLNLLNTPSANGEFEIDLDYQFDTDNFFKPAYKAALEAAAFIWGSYVGEDFADLSKGISFSIQNPQQGKRRESITLSKAIDDLKLFVAAQSPPFNTAVGAAAAGTADGFDAVGTAFRNRLIGSNYEPWAGAISFDPLENSPTPWFFDRTPSSYSDQRSNRTDFLSVALQQMGQILGINGTTPAFQDLTKKQRFVGVNARKVNAGEGVPLETNLGQIRQGFRSFGGRLIGKQLALMEPTPTPDRKLPTIVDLALLADIGYQIPGFRSRGETPPIATPGNDNSPGISGTDLRDDIDALGGNDEVSGNGGDDRILGNDGNDSLSGDDGNDQLSGDDGNDSLSGDDGNDQLSGDLGADLLFGGLGNDLLSGGNGKDQLVGDRGTNTFVGGRGNDTFFAGLDRDRFVFERGDGNDTIADFTTTDDVIQLSSDFGFTRSRQVLKQITNSGTLPSGTRFTEISLAKGDRLTIFHNRPLKTKNFKIE